MATMRVTTLLPLFLLAATISHSAAGLTARRTLAGNWQPIKDVNDPHVQDMARFAVKEHNKEANVHLELVNVVSGEIQSADGINYRLLIVAEDGPVVQEYVTVVWEKDLGGARKLTSFSPVRDPLV